MGGADVAWLESHQSLREHPKCKKFCRLLRVSKPEAVGYLHMLWWWALDYAEDGSLSKYDALDIAIGAEWEGDETQFVDALVTAGFLDRDGDKLVIHDWRDYAGKLIERRARNAQRMREARAEYDTSTDEPRAAHVQRTPDARVQLPTKPTNQTKPTVPNQPDQNQPTEPTENDMSASADEFPAEFVEFWRRYPTGHGSRPKSYAAWKKVRKEHAAIMAGLEAWHRSERWQKGMVKTCELWLRDRLWENPPAAAIEPTPIRPPLPPGVDEGTMEQWVAYRNVGRSMPPEREAAVDAYLAAMKGAAA